MEFDRSRAELAAGSAWLTHGIGSDFRIGMAPHPLVFERGEGAVLVDVDGNRLVDYYLGMGPMILGHCPAVVVDAVCSALERGILFGGQHDLEYEAAELVCELVPCAESVRFTSSGSEAIHAALRLARAVTGRSVVVKFEGHYHGWLDSILVSTAPSIDQLGSVDRPRRVLGSGGQDPMASERVEVLPWNDPERLASRLKEGDVAAVVMEPAMCNTSVVPPRPGYLEEARAACDRSGTLLVFDEVITGFRLAPGGAQERFGVAPDLVVLGKAIASGFPVAALAGRSTIMQELTTAAGGSAVHAGTYNGGVPAMAATVAALGELRRPECHTAIERAGSRLMEGLGRLLSEAGIAHRIQGWPSIFHVAIGVDHPIVDYRSALEADKERYAKLCAALLERGVRTLERGAWFVSTEHGTVIDQTLDAVEDALAAI